MINMPHAGKTDIYSPFSPQHICLGAVFDQILKISSALMVKRGIIQLLWRFRGTFSHDQREMHSAIPSE